MTWTAEKIEQLKKLWNEGKSAGDIAYIMCLPSRNSAIGKINRLGLRRGYNTPLPYKAISQKREKMVHESYGNPERLENLKRSQCHFPVDDMLFCGADVRQGKPYCEGHCAVAYLPKRPSSRDAARDRYDLESDRLTGRT